MYYFKPKNKAEYKVIASQKGGSESNVLCWVYSRAEIKQELTIFRYLNVFDQHVEGNFMFL